MAVTPIGPIAMRPSGIIVANPGANATYNCEDITMVLNGTNELLCEMTNNTEFVWNPPEAPTCVLGMFNQLETYKVDFNPIHN